MCHPHSRAVDKFKNNVVYFSSGFLLLLVSSISAFRQQVTEELSGTFLSVARISLNTHQSIDWNQIM